MKFIITFQFIIFSTIQIVFGNDRKAADDAENTDIEVNTGMETDFKNYTDWMSDLPGTLTLGEISLPGTHDTMALYGGPLAQCQRLTLKQQLNYGIRVLDIRCRHILNACAIHHGPIFQKTFLGTVLNETAQFLAEHPTEVIIMRLKEEYTPKQNNRSLPETIEWYLNWPEWKEYIWSGSGEIPKLGELRGKILILDQIGKPGRQFGPGWFRCGKCDSPCSTPCIQDEFRVRTVMRQDIEKKWAHIVSHFTKANKGSRARNQIFINFLSGTSMSAFPKAVAHRINLRFVKHFRKYSFAYKSVGVVMMDFPLPEQLTQIIGLNFRSGNLLSEEVLHSDSSDGGTSAGNTTRFTKASHTIQIQTVGILFVLLGISSYV